MDRGIKVAKEGLGGGVYGGALGRGEVLLGVVFSDGAVVGGGGGEVGGADLAEVGVEGENVCVLCDRLERGLRGKGARRTIR